MGPMVLFADDEARSETIPWDFLLLNHLRDAGLDIVVENDPTKVTEHLNAVSAVILDMTWYGKVIGPDLFHKIKGVTSVPVIIMSSVCPPKGVGDDYVPKTPRLGSLVLNSLRKFGVV
jgi:hypothetical protein